MSNPSPRPEDKLLPTRSFYIFSDIIKTSKYISPQTKQQYRITLFACLIPDVWSNMALAYLAFNLVNRNKKWYRLTTTFRRQIWKYVGLMLMNQLAMMERNVAASVFYQANREEIDSNWDKITQEFSHYKYDFYNNNELSPQTQPQSQTQTQAQAQDNNPMAKYQVFKSPPSSTSSISSIYSINNKYENNYSGRTN